MDQLLWNELAADFQIGWYILAVFLAFVFGAVWFSLVFSSRWVAIFHVEVPDRLSLFSMVVTMGINLFSTSLFGFLVVIVTNLNASLGYLLILTVFIWEVSTLKFQFSDLTLFLEAVLIHPIHQLLVGLIFIWVGAK